MVRRRELSLLAGEALGLLADRVRVARRERHMQVAEVAERVGVSPMTIRKVERGDPTVALGTAFEVASLVGVALFHEDSHRRSLESEYLSQRLAVLPATVRRRVIDDDF